MLTTPVRPRVEAAETGCGGTELNCVTEWNRIAEDTVVRSRAFQNEGLIYMAYVSAAVYDAVVAIEGRYRPYGAGVAAVPGASPKAAVVEAAYQTLVNYFPTQATLLDPRRLRRIVRRSETPDARTRRVLRTRRSRIAAEIKTGASDRHDEALALTISGWLSCSWT
jgi:hypothetical protein